MDETQARLVITLGGETGDLPDPVPLDATDAEIKQWATEAVRNGDVPGIAANPAADFTDFVINRAAPNEVCNHARHILYPKTPFGS